MDLVSSHEREPLLSHGNDKLNHLANAYQYTSSNSSRDHDQISHVHQLNSEVNSPYHCILTNVKSKYLLKDGKLKAGLFVLVTFALIGLLYYLSYFPLPILHSSTSSAATLKLSIQKQYVSKGTYKYKVFQTGDKSSQVLAQGTYQRSPDTWNQLDVQVTDLFKTNDDRKKMFEQYFKSMEAVGYLEGFATCLDINHYYVNFYSGLFDGGDPTAATINFLEENYEWTSNMADSEWQYSSYWMSVKTLLAQLNGLVQGVQAGCPGTEPNLLPAYLPSLHKNPSLIHMLLLNANGDLYQIAAKFDQPDAGPSTADDDVYSYGEPANISDDGNFTSGSINLRSEGPNQVAESKQDSLVQADSHFIHPSVQRLHHAQKLLQKTRGKQMVKAQSQSQERDLTVSENGKKTTSAQNTHTNAHSSLKRLSRRPNKRGSHCSVLIKLTHDFSDLLYGHDTWDDYQCMGPRIFKRYYLPILTYRGDNGTVPQQDTHLNGVSKSRIITQKEVSGVDEGRVGSGIVSQFVVDNEANEPHIPLGKNADQFTSFKAKSTDNNNGDYNNDYFKIQKLEKDSPKESDEKLSHVDITFMDMRLSSSPGYLSSIDDFFVLAGRANLAVLETSEDMIDESILASITSSTLLSWVRTRVANQLAVSGPHWADVFAVRHSGTYTNQWMVIDLDRFTPGKKPKPNSGLLTILEELPGYIHWEDLTHILAVSKSEIMI